MAKPKVDWQKIEDVKLVDGKEYWFVNQLITVNTGLSDACRECSHALIKLGKAFMLLKEKIG